MDCCLHGLRFNMAVSAWTKTIWSTLNSTRIRLKHASLDCLKKTPKFSTKDFLQLEMISAPLQSSTSSFASSSGTMHNRSTLPLLGEVWYKRQPMGVNKNNQMMKSIIKDSPLEESSKTFSNHSAGKLKQLLKS